ncbi:MAG: hypothetical protein ACUVWP_08345 [bacterium]
MFGFRLSYLRIREKAVLFILLTIFSFTLPFNISAQNYGFTVPKEKVYVYIEPDSSMRIVYYIGFTTMAGYDPIDVVDIGFPTKDYDFDSVKAWIDGKPLTDIRVSEYIPIGVEVHLYGDEKIYANETSVLKVEGINQNMVWQDRADKEYASVEFSPTWFSSDFAFGTTDLTVSFYLPPGVTADEPRWHKTEPTEKAIVDDRVVYTWHIPDASPSQQYIFGASFPNRVITGPIKKEPPFIWKLIVGIFKFLGAILDCLVPMSVLALFIIISIFSSRRRRMQYFPAKSSVEGVGIKRGLTAPEAAVVLEYPLNKVLALVLFGLIKKKNIKVISNDPLKLEKLTGGAPEDKLYQYEKDFISSIDTEGKLDEKKLKDLCIAMIKSVNTKLKFFSLKETREYYRLINAKAWKLLEEAKAPNDLKTVIDDYTEWMMLDEEFDNRMPTIITGRTIYVPDWWENTGTGVPTTPSTGRGGEGPSISLPTLPGSSFAHSITSSVSNFANNIVGSITGFTFGVTSITNPPPVSTSSGGSYGGGGGGGCACACACAGCACACAGGGR